MSARSKPSTPNPGGGATMNILLPLTSLSQCFMIIFVEIMDSSRVRLGLYIYSQIFRSHRASWLLIVYVWFIHNPLNQLVSLCSFSFVNGYNYGRRFEFSGFRFLGVFCWGDSIGCRRGKQQKDDDPGFCF